MKYFTIAELCNSDTADRPALPGEGDRPAAHPRTSGEMPAVFPQLAGGQVPEVRGEGVQGQATADGILTFENFLFYK